MTGITAKRDPVRGTDTFHVSQKLFIINGKRELLILKSANNPFYDVPGGRLDKDEFNSPLLDSLRREIREELGRGVSLTIQKGVVALARDCLWNKVLGRLDYERHVFLLFYEAQYQGGEIMLSDEHESYKWVKIATFNPVNMFKPGTEQAIREYLAKNR